MNWDSTSLSQSLSSTSLADSDLGTSVGSQLVAGSLSGKCSVIHPANTATNTDRHGGSGRHNLLSDVIGTRQTTSPRNNQTGGDQRANTNMDWSGQWQRRHDYGSYANDDVGVLDNSLSGHHLYGGMEDMSASRSHRRSMLNDSLSDRIHSPLRAQHDLKLDLHQDSDSGIHSNPVFSSSTRHRSGSMGCLTPYPSDPPDELNRSFDLSSPRRYSSLTPHTVAGSPRPLREAHKALEESEKRRELLVEKLKDARSTIQMQADRLVAVEATLKDASFHLEDMRSREKDNKKKLSALDKEKQDYHNLRLEGLHLREELQERLEKLDLDYRSLKASHTVLQQDNQKKQTMLEQITSSVEHLEEDNKKLAQTKEKFFKELTAMKDSLESACSKNEWLKQYSNEGQAELDQLRNEKLSINSELSNARRQLSELKDNTAILMQENALLQKDGKTLQDENFKLNKQVDSLRQTERDITTSLRSTAAEKERFFEEKIESNQRVQSLLHDKDCANQANQNLEERLNEVRAELSDLKLLSERKREEKATTDKELEAIKKVSEVLSTELSSSKAKLEKAVEQLQSLEQTKKIAFQQHELYEQEIQSLNHQMNNSKKAIQAMNKDHNREKDISEDHVVKLKEDIRKLRGDVNQMECQQHEATMKLKQSEENMLEQAEQHQESLDALQSQIEQLKSSLSRKEKDTKTLESNVQELQDENDRLRIDHDRLESVQEELNESKESSERFQEENRRLLQERAENQQVIQLLEMQKNILTKNAEGSVNRIQTSEQLEEDLKQLSTDNSQLQEKVYELEKVRDNLIREKEERLASGDMLMCRTTETVTARIEELEQSNVKLRDMANTTTQQLTRLEKENITLKAQTEESVSKTELRRVQREKENANEDYQRMKSQHDQLQHTYQKLLSHRQAMAEGNDNDINRLNSENLALTSEVAKLTNQTSSLERDKLKMGEQSRRNEQQIQDLQEQINEKAGTDFRCKNRRLYRRQIVDSKLLNTVSVLKRSSAQVAEVKNNELQRELGESRNMIAKQEAVILNLRERAKPNQEYTQLNGHVKKTKQSLDDVGEELNHMRTELHKLMEVIQVKDQEIEVLEEQLAKTRKELIDRTLNIGTDDTDELVSDEDIDDPEKSALQKKTAEVSKLRKTLTKLKQQMEEEKLGLLDRLKRELSAKDRQIESLEEQLNRSTSFEIKKMKREASKVELLKAENRRLHAEMTQISRTSLGASQETDDENQTSPGLDTKTTEEQDADQASNSWEEDSDEVAPYKPSKKPPLGSLADEMARAEKKISKDKTVESKDGSIDSPEEGSSPALSTASDVQQNGHASETNGKVKKPASGTPKARIRPSWKKPTPPGSDGKEKEGDSDAAARRQRLTSSKTPLTKPPVGKPSLSKSSPSKTSVTKAEKLVSSTAAANNGPRPVKSSTGPKLSTATSTNSRYLSSSSISSSSYLPDRFSSTSLRNLTSRSRTPDRFSSTVTSSHTTDSITTPSKYSPAGRRSASMDRVPRNRPL